MAFGQDHITKEGAALNCLYVVIPCYNEQEVLPETARRLKNKLLTLTQKGIISPESRVLLVDDGSQDETWTLIRTLHEVDTLFEGIKLSHNRGQQNAFLAGLKAASGKADCVITMDADLQDDIEAMDAMLTSYMNGSDIVFGVRSNRDTDSFFKRHSAQGYYKIMRRMGIELVYNHADYRLMSRRALEALNEYTEVNLFLRGIVPELGFKTDVVYYKRAERFAGETKYPLKKMIALAVEGVTSFSVQPLKIISRLGILLAFLSLAGLVYALISKISGSAVSGWTTIILSIWFLGGLQLLCIGVVGTYIGRIYSEVKARPRYIIEETTLQEEEKDV